MDFISLPLWKRWLFHSLLIWLVINVYSTVAYTFTYAFINANAHQYTLWEQFVNHNLYQETIPLILITILLIELNMYICRGRNIGIHAVGSLLTALVVHILLIFGYHIQGGRVNMSISLHFFFIAGYAFVYPMVLEVLSNRIIRAEKRFEKSKAELNALKTQINPHFLFNTLNSLFGTAIREKANETASGIEQLANMMRYVLNEASENFVPIDLEIKFLVEYIDLQRMRLPLSINEQVTVNVSRDELEAMVAPLLLIPFVENAFKYGVDINKRSYVKIDLSVVQGNLDLTIVNPIHKTQPGSGTGITNARKRLDLIYRNRYTLNINTQSNEYAVHLSIKLL